MQAALDGEWPHVEELFAPVDGALVDPQSLRSAVLEPGRGGRRRGDAVGADRVAGHRWWPARPAHRAPRAPARRDAAPAPLAPGGDLVMTSSAAWKIAADLPDPELPVVTIADLGILRDVTEDDQGRVHVQITPTYSGCPAMETISDDLVDALTAAGYQHVDVEFVLAPAWTTDWMTDEAKAKLAAYGVAPPGPVALALLGALPAVRVARHPRVEPLRVHGVQVAVGVRLVPRAVRPLQGPLSVRHLPPAAGRGDRRADRRRGRAHLRRAAGAGRRLRLRARSAPQHPRRRRRTPLLLDLHRAVLGPAPDRGQAAAGRRVQRGRARRRCASATRST